MITKPRKKSNVIYGVGLNDADYITSHVDERGVRVYCPYYSRWMGIMNRSYCLKFKAKHPTYDDCTVHPEWLVFSQFKTWMKRQDWEGKHLDKDLLVQGNKEYGPLTCLFVSATINNILTLRKGKRGAYPVGVSKVVIKEHEYFAAHCSFFGKQKRLGYFKTPDEAAAKYQEEKHKYIAELAAAQSCHRTAEALNRLIIS